MRTGREMTVTQRVRTVPASRYVPQRAAMTIERRSWASTMPAFDLGGLLGWRAREGKQTSWLGILFILLALFAFSLVTLGTLTHTPGLVI
ncbi:MAG: hypothetical protein IMW89_19970, partial [Ktedonobacteraceae bacterium]|nr:hypothetical protein [Ktedonobacteraceae bacterium]